MSSGHWNAVLTFTKYDFIGFDLDNTLCTYNLRGLVELQYRFMMRHLNARGYNIEEDLSPFTVDFTSRGLIADITKGNLLKANYDGEIIRACHGSRPLSHEEIISAYGREKRWKPLDDLIANNFINVKTEPDVIHCFMDYLEMVCTVIYALAIDSEQPPLKVWQDVFNSFRSMFMDEGWIKDCVRNINLNLYKTPQHVLKWIHELKKSSKIGLISANNCKIGSRVAEFSLGPEWKSLFDFIVFDAKKPSFFYETLPFNEHDGKETSFKIEGSYSGGSLQIIKEELVAHLKREPKCLYIGDSPLHDYVHTDLIDCVAIVEELITEGLTPGIHPHREIITSSFWGPCIKDGDQLTLFGRMSLGATYCAPNISFFADKPVDHVFSSFNLLNK